MYVLFKLNLPFQSLLVLVMLRNQPSIKIHNPTNGVGIAHNYDTKSNFSLCEVFLFKSISQ